MSDSVTLNEVAVTLAHRRRALGMGVLSVAAVTAFVLLMLPSWYTARTSLIPESRSGTSVGGVAGLAALAGLSLPAGGAGAVGQTPQFYAALLTSRPILYSVLGRRYATGGLGHEIVNDDSASLIAIMKVPGDTPDMRLWNGARQLADWITVKTDIRTGIITLTVSHRSPTLAAAIAAAFVQELEQFNRGARQSQAGSRRRFVEERLTVVSADLERAESALRTFLTRNRSYATSPSLQFEFDRLRRALLVQQELYLQLRRELDAARIAEADNIPAITVVEPAVIPQRRAGPARRKWFTIMVLLTGVLLSGWYVLVDHHARLVPGLAGALETAAPKLARRMRASFSRSRSA